MTQHPLDEPVWASLTGAHRHLAEGGDLARRYPPDVSPFHALADPRDEGAWEQLREVAGAGAQVLLPGLDGAVLDAPLPAGARLVRELPGVQLVATPAAAGAPAAGADPGVVVLGEQDVPEVLDLVERTQPGPFGPRTPLLGTYLGVRDDDGRLVAMAGERMRPPGFTEISAVCTDPAARGRGLASRLVRAVAAGVVARGETPFLHALADNAGALRLYGALGFRLRRTVLFPLVELR
ncbi:GNAT family N-acetyltransferase [Paenibacillus sp. TRM 82003]|uniref:GNAT family N-acetyltransferase n=1 Tax=Kineococcus sp. TRM81007 TaxID=2925831 RepID=UPI001F570183|nr:GNAT family N-acetyltransferase [Kineococcus sp. TRM81007]MCI2238718.1 GNAT family N-acetyltransferase [Kineococcus sp. TRM81007]MCI3924124.1 GNAT family N-acetyltransferase [Paenibacillus sp. TRM 82003]